MQAVIAFESRPSFVGPRPGDNVVPLTTRGPEHRCATCNLRERCLPSAEAGFDESVYSRRRVSRGAALYRTGDAFTGLYAVRAGSFKSRVFFDDGRDQVTGFHMQGELLGMSALASNSHSTDMIALEDSEVCVIPAARISSPALQRQLHRIMSRELVREQGVMLLLGAMRAEERLAVFLLDLAQRFAERGFSPREFHLRMTRDEIGSYLGLTLETVSRLFSKFQLAGLMTVHQKHVLIRDASGLKAILGSHLS